MRVARATVFWIGVGHVSDVFLEWFLSSSSTVLRRLLVPVMTCFEVVNAATAWSLKPCRESRAVSQVSTLSIPLPSQDNQKIPIGPSIKYSKPRSAFCLPKGAEFTAAGQNGKFLQGLPNASAAVSIPSDSQAASRMGMLCTCGSAVAPWSSHGVRSQCCIKDT